MNEQVFHVGVKALILNDKWEVLILKANEELLHGKTAHWDLPGGRIHENSTVDDTLRREVEEELGINGGELRIGKLFDASISKLKIDWGSGAFGLVLFTYICSLENVGFKLSNEHTEYKWASIKDASRLLSVKFSKEFVGKLVCLDFNA